MQNYAHVDPEIGADGLNELVVIAIKEEILVQDVVIFASRGGSIVGSLSGRRDVHGTRQR